MQCHWKAPVGHGFLINLKPFHVEEEYRGMSDIISQGENVEKTISHLIYKKG